MHHPMPNIPAVADRNTRLIKMVIVVLVIAAAVALVANSRVLTRYLSETIRYYIEGAVFSSVAARVAVALRSWGEIVLNVPFSRLRNFGGVLAALAFNALPVVSP